VAAAEQHPVKGRAVPSTKGSLPGLSCPRHLASGEAAPGSVAETQNQDVSDSESDGLHDGPCEWQDGYGDYPYDERRCVLCAAAERASKQACPDCGGAGTVAVHVCRDERECARKCLQVQTCMGCLGTGRKAS